MGARNRSSVRTELRDGRKILIVDFRFVDKDGRERRYRRDARVQTAAGARAEAERLRRIAVDRGTLDPEPEAPTFATFAQGDFTRLALPRFKPWTRVDYLKVLRRPEHGLIALVGRKRLDAIGAVDARLVEADALSRGVTAHNTLVCFRSVLKAAVELGALSHMPHLPPLPPVSRKLAGAPPQAVVERALEAAEGWLLLAVALAALAGLRSGELRALEVQDVDLVGRRLFVRRAFSADEVTTPKGRDERWVPLAPALAAMLDEAVAGKLATSRVVVAGRGNPPAPNTIDGAWNALQRRLGVEPRWHFHTLRHFFATTLLARGANVEVVRRLLGHKDLAPTTRYVHATERDLVSAIEALPGNGGETAKPSLQ